MKECQLCEGQESFESTYHEGVAFNGEVSGASFITYQNLIDRTGIGGVAKSNGSWLAFELDGKKLFVSKTHVSVFVYIGTLKSRRLVYGDSDLLTISGKQYKVRLLKGADANPPSFSGNGYYVNGTHSSEWSRLFYPMVASSAYIPVDILGKLASYDQSELDLSGDLSTGLSWVQESSPVVGSHMYRGLLDVSYSHFYSESYAGGESQWRPCLELVN